MVFRKMIKDWISRIGVIWPSVVLNNRTAGNFRLVQAHMGEAMTEQSSQTQENLDDLVHQQLELYAGDLRDLFHKERMLSQDLADKNQQLEQRVRELTALNRLFQEHLLERYAQE